MSNLKQKIIESSYRLYTTQGVDHLTLRAVASELGVTHPAVYTYFQSKEELLAQVKEHTLQLLRDELFNEINPHGTFRQVMQHVADHFYGFFKDSKPRFAIIFVQEDNRSSSELALQILEYLDQLLLLPTENINLPQLFWYGLIGTSHAWYRGEITAERWYNLISELVERLARSQ